MKYYCYGMKLRGYSIGCQPKEGFVKRIDCLNERYYDILVYDRHLTEEEIKKYDLVKVSDEELLDEILAIDALIDGIEKLKKIKEYEDD